MSTETWEYEPAPDLDASLIERLRRFPRQPDMLTYACRTLAALAVRFWLKLYHRFEIHGLENLPRQGSFVMVCNHSSHLDALCLLSALPLSKRHCAFSAAAQDYFFVTLPRLAMAVFIVNALPFDRRSRIRHSLQICRELLVSNPGNILVLFPEGTRSSDGNIHEFKPGIGLLVGGTNLPVVPCYLSGGHRAWPKGRWFPRPRRLKLTIGPVKVYENDPPNKSGAARICRDLRKAVVALQSKVS